MKFDNKTFQQKYEAWKNGADYWKDIRGINLGGNTQAEEPSDEERQKVDTEVQSILNAYNFGKDENDLQNYRGGKDDPINTFVSRMGPIVGQQLNRYGYGDTAYYNVMRQLAYESNYGRSRIAREQHNYGGVGFNGNTYTSYKTDEDFVKDYVRLMHNKYDSALRAKSTQDYARALKQRGYYKDSLENYSRNLRGMDSLVKAAYNHRIRHRDAYNYNVSLKDLVQDYDDVKNSSPIVLNSMSVEQPSTIRADVPKTLIGPTREEVKAQQQKMLDEYRQKMYNQLTSTRLPNILNLLPQNNFGKDSYGQKFWQRRGNNLHFKNGKDERIAGYNPQKTSKQEIAFNPSNYININNPYYHAYNPQISSQEYYDAGQLDDVIAVPSEYDKKLLSITKKMFPNKQARDIVYGDTEYNNLRDVQSFNDRLLNLIQLYKISGSPDIKPFNSKLDILDRPNYNSVTNTIYTNPGSLTSELSHAFQYNTNGLNHPFGSIGSTNDETYKKPGSTEHQAHNTIEPQLRMFLATGDRRYIKRAKNLANKEYSKYGHWWWNRGKD